MIKTGNKNLISKKVNSLLFLVFHFLLFSPLLSYSQKKVEIVNANHLKFDKNLGNGAKRLIGDVEFKHENTLMFCDSAYFYSNNSLDAFGHVHVKQNDSIDMYGDFLTYDGNTKHAVISKNVIVNKGDMHLTTDILNYDMGTNVGYYNTSAKIVNKENVLTSLVGYYYAKTNDLNFKKNVVLTNPQFVINSDTLLYNTISKITYFEGPTTIKSKENLIYCEDGLYDTKKDLSRFSKHSYLLTKEQKMFGDSLYYDRKKGTGRAIKNVEIIDTTHKINIKGEYSIHYEFKDLSIVTGNAVMMQLVEKDTLFLHADTLKAIGNRKKTIPIKSNALNDTINNNSDTGTVSQNLYAYHHVKFYKKDLQGKCDSLTYVLKDSMMKMFGFPTLWSQENQLTSDTIKLIVGSKSLKSLFLKGNGFIVSQEDSLRFNQIRGKEMTGYFNDNHIYLVHVEGNGQTIYYVKDKDELKAVNRADCSDLNIYLKENKIQHITFITKPDANLYPLNLIDVKELRLKDFTWRKMDRPLTMSDIFNW